MAQDTQQILVSQSQLKFVFEYASKLGLIPVDDRETLTKRLIKEFRKHVSNYRFPKQQINTTSDQKALRILSEGR